MALYQHEDKVRLRRQWTEQALNLARQGRWEDAVVANRNVLAVSPEDVEARNRLGKALMELGRYQEAHDAYSESLRLDPVNSIAQKNLQRLAPLLSTLADERTSLKTAKRREGISPQLFIEETGKTGLTSLTQLGTQTLLGTLSTGDVLRLRADDHSLLIETEDGDYVGKVEPRLARRLVELIRGGNRYLATVKSVDDRNVKVLLRETFQHPDQRERISFPSRGAARSEIRPYIKDTVLRYGYDEEEDLLGEGDEAEELEMEGDEAEEEGEFEMEESEE